MRHWMGWVYRAQCTKRPDTRGFATCGAARPDPTLTGNHDMFTGAPLHILQLSVLDMRLLFFCCTALTNAVTPSRLLPVGPTLATDHSWP